MPTRCFAGRDWTSTWGTTRLRIDRSAAPTGLDNAIP